jgi:hypothetical protein
MGKGVEVSKGSVEAAVFLSFSAPTPCRSCRSKAARGVEVHVEAVSKPTNFDSWTLVILGGLDLLYWIPRSGWGAARGGVGSAENGRAPFPLTRPPNPSVG